MDGVLRFLNAVMWIVSLGLMGAGLVVMCQRKLLLSLALIGAGLLYPIGAVVFGQ